MLDPNNFENFSEELDERTIQEISDILQNGQTFTIEHPPVTSPDGTITKETETITLPPPQWLIEGILDGKI